jgi:L-malate glycosyltransferase
MPGSRNNKIRIAYVVPSLNAGGAERFVLDLIKNLDRSRFEPCLFLYDHGGFFLSEAKALGLAVVVLRKKWKIDFKNFRELLQALRKFKPDIIHTQLGGDIYGQLAAKFLKVPAISTEQNVNYNEGRIFNFFKTRTLKLAKKVVAISLAVKDDAISRYQLKPEQVAVIYNGLNIKRFLRETDPLMWREEIVIGSLGRLTAQKNFSVLIKAVALLKNNKFQVLIAGAGEEKANLEKLISELGLKEKIKLVGLQESEEFLNKLDIFVLPSLWEGLGIAVLEAGLKGLPVIASSVDGLKEIITDGVTGWSFESGSAQDLASKLQWLMTNLATPQVRQVAGNLRQKIVSDFDIKKISAQYQAIYENLTS